MSPAQMSSLIQPCQSCDCEESAPRQGLQRRQMLGAAVLGGISAWSLPAAACNAEVLETAKTAAAPTRVCLECLIRRAQQRSPFVNKELP